MRRRVILVGYRASGKSTLGPVLADQLGGAFIDADVALETTSGLSIPQIFAREGEAGFREREHAQLAALLAQTDAWSVLATGGGVVERADNRQLLGKSDDLVVYLEAPAETLVARLEHDDGDRPSLTGMGVAQEVGEILARRAPWYREVADKVVDATLPVEKLLGELMAIVENSSEGS